MEKKENKIELVKLTEAEVKAEKEAARQSRTAYFTTANKEKDKKLKKAIIINTCVLVLSLLVLAFMMAGKLSLQPGIVLLIICCISSTVVSRKIKK